MPRRRTLTLRRTEMMLTEEDEPTVAGTITALDQAYAPRAWAPSPAERWNAQRREQVWRCAEVIVAAAESGATVLDAGTLRQAVVILRAGPGASPLELTMGRSA